MTSKSLRRKKAAEAMGHEEASQNNLAVRVEDNRMFLTGSTLAGFEDRDDSPVFRLSKMSLSKDLTIMKTQEFSSRAHSGQDRSRKTQVDFKHVMLNDTPLKSRPVIDSKVEVPRTSQFAHRPINFKLSQQHRRGSKQ